MKNQTLSIEQMLHLKELGVDTNKASMAWTYIEDKNNPENKSLPSLCVNGENKEWESSSLKTGCVPTFTLQDIIELLPDEIKYSDGKSHHLSFEKDSIRYSYQDFEDECVSVICDFNEMRIYSEPQYLEGRNTIIFDNPKNLLGCAYEMLCWCAENGYLNNNQTK